MDIALVCPGCDKHLKVAEEVAGKRAKCPRCGLKIAIPALVHSGPTAANSDAEPEEVQVVDETQPVDSQTPADDWKPKQTVDFRKSTWRRKLVWALVLLLPVLVVVGLVVAPTLWPKDPKQIVLENYLAAVREGKFKEAEQFGVLDDNRAPIVKSLGRANFAEAEEKDTAGSFKEIAEFHQHIAGKYKAEGEVFLANDITGKLAGTINLRDKILEEQQKAKTSPKKYRDELDAAVDFAENYAKNVNALADMFIGGPQHKSVAVTYEQLLKEWGGELNPNQRYLLDSYRQNRAQWQKLLGRDFQSIGDEGEFTLQESSWETSLWLSNQSYSEPPKKVRVTLVRFSVGLIDSGWKVWEIKRID